MTLASPLLLVVTIIVAFFFTIADAAPVFHWQYSPVTGYFVQDDQATDPSKFDYVRSYSPLRNADGNNAHMDRHQQASD